MHTHPHKRHSSTHHPPLPPIVNVDLLPLSVTFSWQIRGGGWGFRRPHMCVCERRDGCEAILHPTCTVEALVSFISIVACSVWEKAPSYGYGLEVKDLARSYNPLQPELKNLHSHHPWERGSRMTRKRSSDRE